MKKLRLDFQYTQEEYVRAERKFLLASGVITRPKIALTAAYLAYALWYFFQSGGNGPSYLFLGVAFFAIAAGATLYLYAPIRHFKDAQKLQERYNLTFTDLGIEFFAATVRSDLKWETYLELWESDTDYYLLQRGRRYTLLPKRVFPDEEARAAFQELVLQKTGKPKRAI